MASILRHRRPKRPADPASCAFCRPAGIERVPGAAERGAPLSAIPGAAGRTARPLLPGRRFLSAPGVGGAPPCLSRSSSPCPGGSRRRSRQALRGKPDASRGLGRSAPLPSFADPPSARRPVGRRGCRSALWCSPGSPRRWIGERWRCRAPTHSGPGARCS